MAVRLVCVPVERAAVVRVAWPEPLTVPVPRVLVPSLKVTVLPDGMARSSVTVAVKVTVWPKTLGLGELESVVVVGVARTLKTALRALLTPLALAVSCLLVPDMSMRRLVKLAVPLPAPVPMSSLVVPWSGPRHRQLHQSAHR